MQPVATSADRSADELIRLIASQALDPVSVTDQEERGLMKAFRAKEKRLLQKLDDAIEGGADRIARRASERLRRCMAARYLAIWRTKPSALVDRTAASSHERDAVRVERLRQVLSLLESAGDLTVQARATVYVKRKDRNRAYRCVNAPRPTLTSGGSADRRVIFKFDWIDRARQRLIARSLHPFANYHPSQFMLRGRGRSAVCEYLRQEVPTLSADHVFVQVDVRNFFGSISPSWIEGRFRLSEATIRRQMHSGEMLILMDGKARAYLQGGENDERVRRVLPQGSALSPLIAEMAMAEVLRGLTDHLACALVVTYSDNMGVFMPAAQAAAIEDHLRNAFGASGVGPFELTFSKPRPVTGEFSFLGHLWRLDAGELRTFIHESVAEARAIVLREQMLGCSTRKGLRNLRGRILAQANEWKFWSGVHEWTSQLLDFWSGAYESLETHEHFDRLAA
ncbi:hypothetical protein K3181_07865 [Qipengyuania sp. YG27]|uniref:Reverse transcriptase domain-containing protein n=1 Tax=Qipengyuania mesophila TaxID=2867246 RepID=A0ABS7JUV4_9SPHN|nr:reverse transcriptase domain-containing protein [Qipengyuania mesophila]MBX7501354.1 hypothetical protein [Qipengyuania mesophila]